MEWLMQPMNGFNFLDIFDLNADCPNVYLVCNCTGGLIACTVKGALISPDTKPIK